MQLSFDKFNLADEPFAKALRCFETSVLINNNLRIDFFLTLQSPTTFDEIFKFSSVFLPL